MSVGAMKRCPYCGCEHEEHMLGGYTPRGEGAGTMTLGAFVFFVLVVIGAVWCVVELLSMLGR